MSPKESWETQLGKDGPTMDTNVLPSDLDRITDATFDRAERQNQRTIRAEGYGSSDQGLVLASKHIDTLTKHLTEKLATVSTRHPDYELLRTIRDLDPERLALCGIYSAIHGAARENYGSAALWDDTGLLVGGELFAAGLIKHDPKLSEQIAREAKRRHRNTNGRMATARNLGTKYGYKHDPWPREATVRLGAWLIDETVACLSEVFSYRTIADGRVSTTIAPEALEAAAELIGESIERHPVFVPLTEGPPPKWSSFHMKPIDERCTWQVPFLRSRHKETCAAAKHAIKTGAMQPALDAVNALQGVPWAINVSVLEVLEQCIERRIEVKGLPKYHNAKVPKKPADFDQWSIREKIVWTEERDRLVVYNMGLRNQRVSLKVDLKEARYLSQRPCFWTPMNCDWRGRAYALSQFNFAREDHVRALFLFRDGLPIGEDGLKWLKVHVANTGAFNKIDKAPIAERIKWTEDNAAVIRAIAENPLAEAQLAVWTKADKPFLFLAACIETVEALSKGSAHITRLPVSFDGSCSGLQHLAAMTRDAETAALVNLTYVETPQDVYSAVAAAVRTRVAEDAARKHTKIDPKTKEEVEDLDTPKIARMFLDYGITRKICKRNVMTFSYSSPKYGMAQQQQTDLLDALSAEVMEGKHKTHPFAPYHRGAKDKEGNITPGKAARYIASHVYDAIQERIRLPAETMKFLRTIAKALAHEGKPVHWTTPTGIPWINTYRPPVLRRLSLFLHDRGVVRTQVQTGTEPGIDKNKAANGIAANLVHALDAAHLMWTVNACAAADIRSIATVHDSFGCLAPQATEFNKIIRQEFIRMYETHDVLSEVLERAKCDLMEHSWHRLPTVPEYGTLNLQEITDAQYAFA